MSSIQIIKLKELKLKLKGAIIRFWDYIIEIKNIRASSTRIGDVGISTFKNKRWQESFMSMISERGFASIPAYL